MKAKEKITLSDELKKAIDKVSYYDADRFISDAKRYIKAIEERRMLCVIVSVSSSGMSRVLRFISCEQYKNTREFGYMNYFVFFEALGFKAHKQKDGFTIHGCGMDMVFDTNYRIIHRLGSYGFLNKKQVEKLAQQTPGAV